VLSVAFFLDLGGLSSTISSTLASALLSCKIPDLVSSKLNVTLGLLDPSLVDISFLATSSIPLTVNVAKCSFFPSKSSLCISIYISVS